jgi:hypothetical protein
MFAPIFEQRPFTACSHERVPTAAVPKKDRTVKRRLESRAMIMDPLPYPPGA